MKNMYNSSVLAIEYRWAVEWLQFAEFVANTPPTSRLPTLYKNIFRCRLQFFLYNLHLRHKLKAGWCWFLLNLWSNMTQVFSLLVYGISNPFNAGDFSCEVLLLSALLVIYVSLTSPQSYIDITNSMKIIYQLRKCFSVI